MLIAKRDEGKVYHKEGRRRGGKVEERKEEEVDREKVDRKG